MPARPVKNDISHYKPAEILAIAFEVFEQQGFIKSGHGYSAPTDEFDEEGQRIYTLISDNKTSSSKYITDATNEIERINGKLLMKKLGGTLSNFEDGLIKSLEHAPTNFFVSIIASIPNSIEIDKKREALDDKMTQLKHNSQYVGKKGGRYDIQVDVIDVKFIQSSDVYMITAVSDNRDIIKFWWREQPDLTDIIEGKSISLRGTVNKQEVSKYSDAKETLFNRVKLSF
jgi:hypothetical protein